LADRQTDEQTDICQSQMTGLVSSDARNNTFSDRSFSSAAGTCARVKQSTVLLVSCDKTAVTNNSDSNCWCERFCLRLPDHGAFWLLSFAFIYLFKNL